MQNPHETNIEEWKLNNIKIIYKNIYRVIYCHSLCWVETGRSKTPLALAAPLLISKLDYLEFNCWVEKVFHILQI